MASKTFSATRGPQAGDGRQLASWSLSAGGTALVVNFCEETSGSPLFQVQVPINTSASQAYPKPIKPPAGGRWHVQVVSGTLVRGTIDLI
jgi:hypothetical protein